MSETLLRQWAMLRAIPRAPRKIDVSTLIARLEAAGYQTTRRSVQRDLNMLSTIFPLMSDDRTIPYGWCWSPDAPVFDLPAMDGHTALAVRMIEQFIPALLPPTLNDYLGGYFARAEAVLRDHAPAGLGQWSGKVRVVAREMPLLPPKSDREATRIAYQALLEERRFTADYLQRGANTGAMKSYEVNPLGVVLRGNLAYLVCTLWDYEDVRQLAMHRIERVELTDRPVTRPAGFDLDRYIGQGEFHFLVGPTIELKAIFDRGAAAHLYETPLSEDQVIEDVDEIRLAVTATIQHTRQLEWWLRGFGDLVEVVLPAEIRDRMRASARICTALYE